MIRVIVSGCLGKMGSRVVARMKGRKDMEFVAGLEAPGCPAAGQDAGEILGLGRMGGKISTDLSQVIQLCDVVVDFTNPDATLEHLRIARRHKKGAVVGTTGLSEIQMKEARELSAEIPMVVAPNMSVGVNLLYKLVEQAGRVLGEDYDIEILEAHHRAKRDAPSGTAKRLSEILCQVRGWKVNEVLTSGRSGLSGGRKKKEIAVFSLRAGDVVGEHTVLFAGDGERLELTHRAHNRDTFARGALEAIKFVAQAKPGWYDMMDALGLKK
jgi:4-hydroxy-tetrahydrodipicolinate reductase